MMTEVEYARKHAENTIKTLQMAIEEDMDKIITEIKYVSEMKTGNVSYKAEEMISVLNSSVVKDLQMKLGSLQTAMDMMKVVDFIAEK